MATAPTYIYPVTNYKLTQDWGDNPAYYAQFGQLGHNGLDLGVALNTPVVASRSGTVIYAGNGASLPYVGSIAGNYVLIDHGDMWTGYAHNNTLNVKTGQTVKQGDIIAYAGKTGTATGVHVHFEFITPANPVTNNNGFYGRVDPNIYLKGDTMTTISLNAFRQAYYTVLGFNGVFNPTNSLSGAMDDEWEVRWKKEPYNEAFYGYLFDTEQGKLYREWLNRQAGTEEYTVLAEVNGKPTLLTPKS